MEMDKYLNIFLDESRENLEKLNDSLLKLENNSSDIELLNDIFRVAHTFKGMSCSMGFIDVGDLTHRMENILEDMRQGKLEVTEKVTDILFNCLDKLQEMVDKIAEGTYQDSTNNIDILINSLQALAEDSTYYVQTENGENNNTGEIVQNNEITEEKTEQTSASFADMDLSQSEIAELSYAKENGLNTLNIYVKIAPDCVLPSVRAFMVINLFKEPSKIVKTIPALEMLENGDFQNEFQLAVVTNQLVEELETSIKNILDIEEVKIKSLDLAKCEGLAQQKSPSNNGQAQTTSAKAGNQTIRVNSNKLNHLMNLVGELVINRTRLAQLSRERDFINLSSVIDLMGNITTDIQETVMELRMVPIEQVFNRFPRLVRDLSKTLHKNIELKLTGKETEIDRIVIEEIGDPLIHLLRNSMDHGIETPEERIQKGKPETGIIELSAFNEGDNIIIRISDDGRGIDPEKIKRVALQKGLITNEEAQKMSDSDAIELIFLPGFSSAEVTTDISGRGVGMDVVKSKISSLGGTVHIASKPGEGSEVTICLPSTMAIIQALLVGVEEEIYALPLNNVAEVIEINKSEVTLVQNNEVIVLRDTVIPIFKLHKILEVPDYKESDQKIITVIIIKTQNKYFGVVVDKLVEQQEVVIKPVNKKLCPDNIVSGATTLGSGKVALILNVNGLI